ncbi:KamA family radical SAM protein [Chlamydiales bacterium]|nr:KamA family radical SAM protein [Chlamydiales bacterium]
MWKKILQKNLIEPRKKKDHFPLYIPERLTKKMEKNDPLYKQFVPSKKEEEITPGFSCNPTGDVESLITPKLLHKYQGRALLIASGACAMHCRYCFRQHFSYESDKDFSDEMEHISKDSTIEEILLSGGDPLSLSDKRLGDLLKALNDIPHVQRVRFHTRFPVGIPERITEEFILSLKKFERTMIFVLHINHSKETDDDFFKAMRLLTKENILLFCQSVLLRGVNDDVLVLRELYLSLIKQQIIPYYLHQLDQVQGAKHFEVPVEEGKKIYHELQKVLPGYALPRYVKEVAGAPYKVPLYGL